MGDRADMRMRPQATPAGEPEISVDLPCTLEAAVHARRLVVDACGRWSRATCGDSAELVAAELVANAVRHARTSVRLTMRPTEDGVQIEVSDDSPRMPQRRDPGLFDESGRGLWLVDAIAGRWGVEREQPGKRVWAEVTAG